MRRVAYQGVIVNVDGVLVDSPHELAWRDALQELMEGEWSAIRDRTSWSRDRLTPALYQEEIAGKARLAGARAALEHFGVPDVDRRAQRYAAVKQERLVALIDQGRFMAFPDALRLPQPAAGLAEVVADDGQIAGAGVGARAGVGLAPGLHPGRAGQTSRLHVRR